jgi:hypothetical protein
VRTFPTSSGPFAERPHFDLNEIERLCWSELQSVGLLPKRPEAIRIERFVEKRFGVSVTYDDLPRGVLAFTRFGARGVESVVVSRALADDGGKVAERRLNTTIAHEAGHGLLHAYLFILGGKPQSLFDNDSDVEPTRILCRDVKESTARDSGQGSRASYDGRWWEWQANRAMGALLLPRQLVGEALVELTEVHGSIGRVELPSSKQEQAVALLAGTFDVNPVVARLRLQEVYSQSDRSPLVL